LHKGEAREGRMGFVVVMLLRRGEDGPGPRARGKVDRVRPEPQGW